MGSAVVPVAAVPVGSVCTITIHRRCLATQSIRHRYRLGLCAQRTNTNLTTTLVRLANITKLPGLLKR